MTRRSSRPARVFAEGLLMDAGSDEERLGKAYERALGRPIKAEGAPRR